MGNNRQTKQNAPKRHVGGKSTLKMEAKARMQEVRRQMLLDAAQAREGAVLGEVVGDEVGADSDSVGEDLAEVVAEDSEVEDSEVEDSVVVPVVLGAASISVESVSSPRIFFAP